MIELLVVIAVIGIISSALIIALDPTERINQARDGNARSALTQLYKAAVHGATISGGTPIPTNGTCGSQQPLINAGELKRAINDGSGGPYYYVRDAGACSWVPVGDFQVAITLRSKKSIQEGIAYPGSGCTSAHTSVQYSIWYLGNRWGYWCSPL